MQNLQIPKGGLGTYCITWIGWNPSKAGWHSLNTDGCVADLHFSAGGGGLIRVSSGKWAAGFSKNLGSCLVEEVELWALFLGLQLAWDNNILELDAKIDSKVVFEWVTRHMDCNHNYAALLRECHLLLRRNWELGSVASHL